MKAEEELDKFNPDDKARESHCRYCHNLGPDAHPALDCKDDAADAAVEIATVLYLAREAIAHCRALMRAEVFIRPDGTIHAIGDALEKIRAAKEFLDGTTTEKGET